MTIMTEENAISFVATRLAMHSIERFKDAARVPYPEIDDSAFSFALIAHDNNRAACDALGFAAAYDEVFAHLAACNRVKVTR